MTVRAFLWFWIGNGWYRGLKDNFFRNQTEICVQLLFKHSSCIFMPYASLFVWLFDKNSRCNLALEELLEIVLLYGLQGQIVHKHPFDGFHLFSTSSMNQQWDSSVPAKIPSKTLPCWWLVVVVVVGGGGGCWWCWWCYWWLCCGGGELPIAEICLQLFLNTSLASSCHMLKFVFWMFDGNSRCNFARGYRGALGNCTSPRSRQIVHKHHFVGFHLFST